MPGAFDLQLDSVDLDRLRAVGLGQARSREVFPILSKTPGLHARSSP